MVSTLYVVDDGVEIDGLPHNTLSFEEYLRDYPKADEGPTRVINLCNTERYLSQGYYCSLLAEARRHEVLPSVRMINALRSGEERGIWLAGKTVETGTLTHNQAKRLFICMGQTASQSFGKIASVIFQRYPAPLISATLTREGNNIRTELKFLGLPELSEDEHSFCWQTLSNYDGVRLKKTSGKKKFRWEMALLVNPEEPSPPSNKSGIASFVRAGSKLGIGVHVLSANQIQHINQYDALFIRETTAIDNHTYRLATEAENNGLVVIDDPDSILRCCNKIFLHDAFTYRKVPSLKTLFVRTSNEKTLNQLESELGYPVVLKLPESAFSRGVFKVEDRAQLQQKLGELLHDYALILAQQYLYTDYDWRIGVLNGRALYACRYYMARNHWQIYNHGSKKHSSGDFDTLPTFEVPRTVLEAALKGAAVVGKGLYGVDIKVSDNRAYVIEVNDNPSIEQGIEDKYLGEELYMQIMSEFLHRLEKRGAK